MLLPREIRKKEFSHAIGGYAKNEVQSYLDYIATSYETLRRENDELTRKLEAAYNCIDELHKAAADREQGSATGKPVDERVFDLCREVVTRLQSDLERLKTELSVMEGTLFTDEEEKEKSAAEDPVIQAEAEAEAESEAEVEVEVEAEVEAEVEIEAEAEATEDETETEVVEEIEFDVPEDEAEIIEQFTDEAVFDLEALLADADDALETEVEYDALQVSDAENEAEAEEPAEVTEADGETESEIEIEPTLPDDIDSFMDGLFAVPTEEGEEFSFELPEDEPEQIHIDTPVTDEDEPTVTEAESTAEPTEPIEPVQTPSKPKVKKRSYKISRAAKKPQPVPVSESESESELDEDAEALLQLLKERYAPTESSVAEIGDDDVDADGESFETHDFDEFNYFFADTENKIETVPTKKNNDIDDI